MSMKFLVVARPNGQPHGLSTSPESVHAHANAVEAALAEGSVEAAYAIVAGGYVSVFTAKDTEQLARMVRYNPLFKSSSVDIIPIADAQDFLHGVAKEMASLSLIHI